MRKLLLIVDDWEALEVYEGRFLPHFEVICAPFGSEGIRIAEEMKPDLILLDLVFEDMSPEEGLESLKSNPLTQSIPVFVIVETPLESPAPRVVSFSRPYDFSELLRIMKV